jgi:PAS domain-containing protein
MISGHTLAKNLRQWGVVFGSGLAGFALGVILFSFYGLDGIFHALNSVPIAAGVGLSLVLALAFMAGGALFALAQERWRNLLARIALNNMTQALCMYDAAGRLVLCNVRFMEMYNLRREQLRGGMRCANCSPAAPRQASSPAIPNAMPANASERRPRAPPIRKPSR